MPLFVDHREPIDIYNKLKYRRIDVQIYHLEVGDYVIPFRITIMKQEIINDTINLYKRKCLLLCSDKNCHIKTLINKENMIGKGIDYVIRSLRLIQNTKKEE